MHVVLWNKTYRNKTYMLRYFMLWWYYIIWDCKQRICINLQTCDTKTINSWQRAFAQYVEFSLTCKHVLPANLKVMPAESLFLYVLNLHISDRPPRREGQMPACDWLLGCFSRDIRKLCRIAGKFSLVNGRGPWRAIYLVLLVIFLHFTSLWARISQIIDMVKTRSQQKIGFPRRKAKSESKSVGKSLDGEPKTKSRSCIATLARACRDKSKG
jgi:hypothetical protein